MSDITYTRTIPVKHTQTQVRSYNSTGRYLQWVPRCEYTCLPGTIAKALWWWTRADDNPKCEHLTLLP